MFHDATIGLELRTPFVHKVLSHGCRCQSCAADAGNVRNGSEILRGHLSRELTHQKVASGFRHQMSSR
eukprot:229503-Alexandrium_andersonii.AAC.1